MSDIDYTKPMDPDRVDSAGHAPNRAGMQGAQFRHWKTQRVYRVIGFVWDGERDLWLVKFVDIVEMYDAHRILEHPQEYVRSIDNFLGEVDTGDGGPAQDRMKRV